MSRAALEAGRVLKDYFHARGEETPQKRAARLIHRVTIDAANRWRSDDLVASATEILESSAFDVDDLTENFFNLTLEVGCLAHLDAAAGAKVFGAAYPEERRIIVCERAEAYLPLYRSTAAHELGHVLLHGGANVGTLTYSPYSPRRPRYEYEADEFMHTLLIPDELLILAVGLCSQNWGLSLHETLGRANSRRGRWQWRHYVFRPMIERLCLSREMLAVRLRALGIFSEGTLKYHKSYALPNVWRANDFGTPGAPLNAYVGRGLPQATHA